MEKRHSTLGNVPIKPLEVLPGMLHAVMIQTATVFSSPDKQHPRALQHTNALIRTSIPGATERFQYALDLLEIEILKAKAVLTRDLNKRYRAVETAKQRAIEEELAAQAREQAEREETEKLSKEKEESERLALEQRQKEQDEAEQEKIRKETKEQESRNTQEKEAKEKAEREAEEKERKTREVEEEKAKAEAESQVESNKITSADKPSDNLDAPQEDSLLLEDDLFGDLEGQEDTVPSNDDLGMDMGGIIDLAAIDPGSNIPDDTPLKNSILLDTPPADGVGDQGHTDFLDMASADLFGEDVLPAANTSSEVKNNANDDDLNLNMDVEGNIDMDMLFGDTSAQDNAQELANANPTNDLTFDMGTDGKLDIMNLDMVGDAPMNNTQEGMANIDTTMATNLNPQQLNGETNEFQFDAIADGGNTFEQFMQELTHESLLQDDDMFNDQLFGADSAT